MNSNKLTKYVRYFKKSHSHRKDHKFNLFNLNSKRSKEKLGHFEFYSFITVLTGGLFYISRKKEKFSETTRLISCGIVTHLLVDFITYSGDLKNTKVKVESFRPAKVKGFLANLLFKGKYLFDQKSSRKREYKRTLMKNYQNSYRGIQSAFVYLTFNSILFYGCYKNFKRFLSEQLNIHGFLNFATSAAVAQVIAMSFSFPLEVMKTRMQVSSKTYTTLIGYYKNLIVKKPYKEAVNNIKKEYSGFSSHLLLYVVYEALTFGVYESLIDYFRDNKIMSDKIENATKLRKQQTTHRNISEINNKKKDNKDYNKWLEETIDISLYENSDKKTYDDTNFNVDNRKDNINRISYDDNIRKKEAYDEYYKNSINEKKLENQNKQKNDSQQVKPDNIENKRSFFEIDIDDIIINETKKSEIDKIDNKLGNKKYYDDHNEEFENIYLKDQINNLNTYTNKDFDNEKNY